MGGWARCCWCWDCCDGVVVGELGNHSGDDLCLGGFKL